MSDDDLQAMAQGYIDSTRLLVEIAELVGIEGVIHGPEVLAAIEALITERDGLLRELDRERIASEIVTEMRDEIRRLRTAVDRMRSYDEALRRLGDKVGDGDIRLETELIQDVNRKKAALEAALAAVEGEV